MHTFQELKEVVAALRGEGGCTWDRAQTQESLIPYLMEESGEVRAAIGGNHDTETSARSWATCSPGDDPQPDRRGERGFTVDDVVARNMRKMIRRHPHVFGDGRSIPPKKAWRCGRR